MSHLFAFLVFGGNGNPRFLAENCVKNSWRWQGFEKVKKKKHNYISISSRKNFITTLKSFIDFTGKERLALNNPGKAYLNIVSLAAAFWMLKVLWMLLPPSYTSFLNWNFNTIELVYLLNQGLQSTGLLEWNYLARVNSSVLRLIFLFFLDFYGDFSQTPYLLYILKLDNFNLELIGLISCGILT